VSFVTRDFLREEYSSLKAEQMDMVEGNSFYLEQEIREANTNRFKFRVTQEMREYPPEIYEFLPDCHAINDLVEELCFDM